jgi:hypothetical protein
MHEGESSGAANPSRSPGTGLAFRAPEARGWIID